MDQKIKFIIIGLAVFCLACLLLFVQSFSQQQRLVREGNDLKTENAALVSKASKLENDLKDNQGKINSLKAERDKGIEELNALQKKFESVGKIRDELIEKLKEKSRAQQAPVVSAAPAVQPEAPVAQNTDAYWGTVLKAKKELEMQLSSIRVELRNLQMINESLRKDKTKTELELKLETQLSSVRAELKNLQINNESLRREKSILEIDIVNLRSEKKDIQRQLDYNQKLLDSMSQEVVRERNDKMAIQDSSKTIKAENKLLVRQLKSLVNRKMLLDKKVADLSENKSVLEKRLNEMERMIAGRAAKIDALKNELSTVKGEKAQDTDKGSVELPAIVVRSASSSIEKSQAQIQEFGGKVLAVNLDSNFVVIDSGSSGGVKVGDVFNIYRDGRSIATIEVIQTRASISACDIKTMSTPLKIGDYVK
ncbi:MAG: hypothetical protein V1830_04930 [Candidatus Omnitrophota bacterium]